MSKSNNKNKTKKYFVYFISLLLVVVLGLAGYKHWDPSSPVTQATKTIRANNKGINFKPATQQDKTDAENNKDKLVTDQTKNATASRPKISVQPVTTYADKNTVNGYVTGVFEEGGTCNATLTQGSQTITRMSTGFGNASYTQCRPISLAGINLGTGPWSVVLTYSSSRAEGKSQAVVLKP